MGSQHPFSGRRSSSMSAGHLRSQSFHFSSQGDKEGNLSKFQTFQRHIGHTMKRRREVEEVTKTCTNELEFVKFDVNSDSIYMGAEQNTRNLISSNELTNETITKDDALDESPVENDKQDVKTRKGILWQQTDNIFSSWQERFFVLTENSLYSFSRENKKMEMIGKSVSKVKLSDFCDVSLVDRKGQLMINILTTKNVRIYLRKPEGLRYWFRQILENISEAKFTHQNRKLESSLSLVEKNHLEHSVAAVQIPNQRPVMCCRSLSYGTQKHLQLSKNISGLH